MGHKTAYKSDGKLAFYGEFADMVVYDDGSIMTSVDFLDPSYVAFIEARIAEGKSLESARLSYEVAIGER